MSIEKLIFNNLLNNEEYSRKVIPYLRSEYFSDRSDKIIYKLIDYHINKYNVPPTQQTLKIDLEKIDTLNEDEYNACIEIIEETSKSIKIETNDWLVDTTEKFCQDKAIYNAIMQSIKIIEGKDTKLEKGAIPEILADALGIVFDNSIGHDFIEDADERFEYYHRTEEKLPFDIDILNLITKGGLPKKTLTCIMAPIGVGKSLIMCHMAASNLAAGKNVLYITLEMAEEKIAERIDANLMNITIDDIHTLTKEAFDKKIKRVKDKTPGKLIIKEYPAACVGSANFRHLINDLKIKKKFIPDIIYIDYLNLCISSRIKNTNSSSYTLVKSIAEEVRGLTFEFNIPIVTATQTTRDGLESSDLSMGDTSESIGLPATLDLYLAVVQPEELIQLNQFLFIQLKNRLGDVNFHKKFIIGVDKPKMKLYNTEKSSQDDIHSTFPVDDKPLMDNTTFGERYKNDTKKSFKGFK